MIISMVLEVKTSDKRQVVDITDEVAKCLQAGQSGVVNVFIKHTTAAITTADLDPGTDLDILDFLQSLIPDPPVGGWRHPHDPSHAPDHLLSSLIGPEVTVPVLNGSLELGAWQKIILIEIDGPRQRQVEITFIKA